MGDGQTPWWRPDVVADRRLFLEARGRMLEGAARILVKQFFERLAAQIGGAPTAAAAPRWQWWRRLLAWLGGAS